MAQITVSGVATSLVDGITQTSAQSFVVDAAEVAEQVSDITDTYAQFVSSGWQVFFCANLGGENLLVEIGFGSDFWYMTVPPSGHILIPAYGQFGTIAIRSETSAGTRVHMAAIY